MAKQLTIEFMARADAYFSKIDQMEARTKKAMENMESSSKKVDSSLGSITNSIKNVGMAFGVGFGISEIADFTIQAIKLSMELDVLKSHFSGTSEDIEKLKDATGHTVSEAGLIKLSNQASDLGVSLKNQETLFSVARNAANKYGIDISEAFQKVIYSTEGNMRGLKMLGIQKAEYEQILKSLTMAEGEELKNLDAEEQKRLRLEALVKAAGKNYSDLTSVMQEELERMKEYKAKFEDIQADFGSFLLKSWAGFKLLIGGPDAMFQYVVNGREALKLQQQISDLEKGKKTADEESHNATQKKSLSELQTMYNNQKKIVDELQEKKNVASAKEQKLSPEDQKNLEIETVKVNNYYEALERKKTKDIETSKKSVQQRAEIEKSYYDTVKFEDTKYADFELNLINEKMEKYKKAGGKEVEIEKWKNEEKKKLANDFLKSMEGKYPYLYSSKGEMANVPLDTGPNHLIIRPDLKERNPLTNKPDLGSQENILGDWVKQSSVAESAFNSFENSVVGGFKKIFEEGKIIEGLTSIWTSFFQSVLSQLEELIAKWITLNIVSALAGGPGISFLSILGIKSSVASLPAGPIGNAPISQGLSAINSSIQAMNINQIQRGAQPVIIMLDGKVLASSGVKNQNNFEDRNVKLARVG
jgi:hypothetical protein